MYVFQMYQKMESESQVFFNIFFPYVSEEVDRPKSSFADLYRKKYGSSKVKSTSTTRPTVTEKVTYPPRPATTSSRYNRFVPTIKPFTKPNFLRIRTTTLPTTEQTTTSTTTTTTTKKLVIQSDLPTLDTSLFSEISKAEPSEQSFNSLLTTDNFQLDSMNFEDGESAMAQTSKADQRMHHQIVSEPKATSKSPVPIRKVLDIFQELRLSFGRN